MTNLLQNTVLAAIVAALLTSCSSTWRMMPTPVLHQQLGEEYFQELNPGQTDSDMKIFFATNRMPSGKKGPGAYGNEISQDMRVGTATIQFGERPLNLSHLIQLSTQEQREGEVPMIMRDSIEQGIIRAGEDPVRGDDARAFAAAINEVLDASEFKKIHIYVHGARSSFYRCSVQGGQLHHFMTRDGAFIVLSWPTTQSFLTYQKDVAAARQSTLPLVNLLDFLAHNTKAKDINILAYSAGSQVIAPALAELRRRYAGLDRSELRQRLKIQEAYFAASDVATIPFVDDYFPAFYDLVGATTVTEHSDDAVLKISQISNRESRLGRPGAGDLNEEQIDRLVHAANARRLDWIDMAFEDGERPVSFKGHAYWYANPWVSSDVILQFLFNEPPDRRGLIRKPVDLPIWYFPKDYPERLESARKQIGQRLRAGHYH